MNGPIWLVALVLASGAFALADDPPVDLAQRAIGLYEQEKYAEARLIFEELDAAGLATGPLLYRLTFCLRVAGEREKEQQVLVRAIAKLEEEVLLAPDLEPAFYLANAYRNLRRAADAKQAAAAATARIESGDLEPGGSALECFRAGKLYADQAKTRQASEWYAKALEGFASEPGSQPAYVRWATAYLGDVAYSQGRFEDSAKHFSSLVESGAARASDFDRLAAALARQQEWAGAEQAWRGAEKANPADANRARYAYRLAAAANKLGQLPDQDLSGTTWKSMSKEDLEAFLAAQSERVKAIHTEATIETDAARRTEMQNEVTAIRAAFAPTEEEVTAARRVLSAHEGSGAGVLSVDGSMVDRPVVEAARRLLERAERAGRPGGGGP